MTPSVALLFALLTAFPCEEARTLAHGDPSPCEGLLVPTTDAIKALHCSRVALPGCRIELESAEATCAIRLDGASKEQDALMTRITHAEAVIGKLSKPEPQHWWDSPMLWGGGGVVVGVGVTLAILRATVLAQ